MVPTDSNWLEGWVGDVIDRNYLPPPAVQLQAQTVRRRQPLVFVGGSPWISHDYVAVGAESSVLANKAAASHILPFPGVFDIVSGDAIELKSEGPDILEHHSCQDFLHDGLLPISAIRASEV